MPRELSAGTAAIERVAITSRSPLRNDASSAAVMRGPGVNGPSEATKGIERDP